MNADLLNEIDQEFNQKSSQQYVHIRLQQRNNRKTITTVEGLSNDLDLKLILKVLRKNCNCNGHIAESEELGKILQFQGDQRNIVRDFLVREEIVSQERIKIHGAN